MAGEPNDFQGCRLTSLPAEIQLAIIDLLSSTETANDLRALSSTNRFYRNLLAPQILRSIILTNTERNGASIEAIADGRHAKCMKHLHYRGMVPDKEPEPVYTGNPLCLLPPEPKYEADPPGPIPFPPSVQSILSKLERFSNLQSVVMDFPFDDWDNFADLYHQIDDTETAEEVLKAELENGWRALMAQSFNALSQNRKALFKHLEIRQLVPYAVSTFDTDAFHAFLGNLKAFTLSLRGWDNGAGWQLNTLDFAADFAGKLDTWFFDHLGMVHHLVFEASDMAPIGLDPGRYHSHLALKPGQMTSLRSVQVRYLFICPELRDFLVAHADTLEEIVMLDCLASVEVLDEDTEGMAWCRLFDAISEATPSKLRRLEVRWTEEVEWGSEWEDAPEDVNADTDKIRQFLEDDPEAVFFNYTNLDDKYGMLFEDEHEIRSSFLQGGDQKAYKRLMAIVEKNRMKTASSSTSTGEPGRIVEHQWHVADRGLQNAIASNRRSAVGG
jgi:hypothetical protein